MPKAERGLGSSRGGEGRRGRDGIIGLLDNWVELSDGGVRIVGVAVLLLEETLASGTVSEARWLESLVIHAGHGIQSAVAEKSWGELVRNDAMFLFSSNAGTFSFSFLTSGSATKCRYSRVTGMQNLERVPRSGQSLALHVSFSPHECRSDGVVYKGLSREPV